MHCSLNSRKGVSSLLDIFMCSLPCSADLTRHSVFAAGVEAENKLMRKNLYQIKGKLHLRDLALLFVSFSPWIGKHSYLGFAGLTNYFSIAGR